MTVPANTNPLLLRSAAPAAYQISRSLRFNSADSAYLSRTPGSAGNQQTWTLSMWVKRSKLGSTYRLFDAYTSASDTGYTLLGFSNEDKLIISGWNNNWKITTQVFRDVSAWYHIVVAFDVTQATGSNRIKFYVNGTQITAFDTDVAPAQNTNHAVNGAIAHAIGRYSPGPSQYFDGYIADVYLLDGTATTPSTFAETDAITGQWVPKTPTGISYGTNGFRLTFSDNSGTTATTLGKDAAGSNNWTPNNFSVASGAGNDSLVDSPTGYGTDTGAGNEVRGNYACWNPLTSTNSITLANGNLYTAASSASGNVVRSTILAASGKWYFEVTYTSSNAGNGTSCVGVVNDSQSIVTPNSLATVPAGMWLWRDDSYKINNGTGTSYGTSASSNDVIMVAFDVDAGKVWFGRQGTWFASGNPASGTNESFSGLTGSLGPCVNFQGTSGSPTFDLNAGQRPFAYTAPSGFKALCDTNLTAPTIAKPADQFGILLWTGNTTNGNGSRAISGLNFQPEFVWIKARSASVYGHLLFDAVRGAANSLASESTAAEGTPAANGKLDSFDSTGFTVNNGTSNGWYVNTNGENYVGWCWNAASSNSTNTQGSITSTVRANATAGFSIVTYTGTGANATIGHGCGAAPAMIILKNRDDTYGWYVYHTSIGATKYLKLNETAAQDTSSSVFNNTAPTSTVFSIGTFGAVNGSSQKIVTYCFAPVAGYSAFGSYTGNGSSDGPFVFCNFRPRYLMVKASSTGGSYYYWYVFDSVRDTANPTDLMLFPNVSDAESSTYDFDFLANGFKVRTNAIYVNNSAVTYIYAAFAENPFQYARAK